MVVSEPLLNRGAELTLQDLLDLYRVEAYRLSEMDSLAGRATPLIERGLERFHGWMDQQPAIVALQADDQGWRHARSMHASYWQDVLSAEINDAYRDKRYQIGAIHAERGLPLLSFMAGVSMVYGELSQGAQQLSEQSDGADELIQSITSLLHLDAGLICQAFVDRHDELLVEQDQWVQTLPAPITEVWPRLLLLPLVGAVDTTRAENLLAALLEAVQKARARHCIIDVAGLEQLDAIASNALLSMARGCELMGGTLTLTGLDKTAMPVLPDAIGRGALVRSPTLMEAISAAVARITAGGAA